MNILVICILTLGISGSPADASRCMHLMSSLEYWDCLQQERDEKERERSAERRHQELMEELRQQREDLSGQRHQQPTRY